MVLQRRRFVYLAALHKYPAARFHFCWSRSEIRVCAARMVSCTPGVSRTLEMMIGITPLGKQEVANYDCFCSLYHVMNRMYIVVSYYVLFPILTNGILKHYSVTVRIRFYIYCIIYDLQCKQ